MHGLGLIAVGGMDMWAHLSGFRTKWVFLAQQYTLSTSVSIEWGVYQRQYHNKYLGHLRIRSAPTTKESQIGRQCTRTSILLKAQG